MDMLEVIARSHGGRGLQALGAKFQLTESQTRAAVNQLAPAVQAGIRRQLQSGPEGVSGLLSALATGNHGRYLDRDDDGIVDDGNAILGKVFRSKDVSRGVAERASAASGVSADVLRKMLPVVTAMVMGGLSQQLTARAGAGGADAARPNRRGGGLRRSTPSATATPPVTPAPAPGKVASRSTQSRNTQPASAMPTPAPGKVASRTTQSRNTQPAARIPAPAPAPAPPAAGGLGGLLGQLVGGGSGQAGGGGGIGDILGQLIGGSAGGTRAAAPGAGGGGIGDILGQLVGGGAGGSSAAGGGGLGDILGGLFGSNAKPEVRDQATQSIGGFLSDLLGGGTAQGSSADQMLDQVTRSRTGR